MVQTFSLKSQNRGLVGVATFHLTGEEADSLREPIGN